MPDDGPIDLFGGAQRRTPEAPTEDLEDLFFGSTPRPTSTPPEDPTMLSRIFGDAPKPPPPTMDETPNDLFGGQTPKSRVAPIGRRSQPQSQPQAAQHPAGAGNPPTSPADLDAVNTDLAAHKVELAEALATVRSQQRDLYAAQELADRYERELAQLRNSPPPPARPPAPDPTATAAIAELRATIDRQAGELAAAEAIRAELIANLDHQGADLTSAHAAASAELQAIIDRQSAELSAAHNAAARLGELQGTIDRQSAELAAAHNAAARLGELQATIDHQAAELAASNNTVAELRATLEEQAIPRTAEAIELDDNRESLRVLGHARVTAAATIEAAETRAAQTLVAADQQAAAIVADADRRRVASEDHRAAAEAEMEKYREMLASVAIDIREIAVAMSPPPSLAETDVS